MAGIGHEIHAHGLQPAGGGEVAEEQHHSEFPVEVRGVGVQGADQHLEGSLRRDPLHQLHAQALPRAKDAVDAVEDVGAAQREGQRMTEPEAGQERLRGCVGLDDDGAGRPG